jgi:hypothetical protein
MQTPSTTQVIGLSQSRKRKRLALGIGGLAALAVVVLALAAGQAPQTGMRRYVSPPRKDGTRYTFLYPASIGDPEEDTLAFNGGTSLDVNFGHGPPGLLDRTLMHSEFLWRLLHRGDAELLIMSSKEGQEYWNGALRNYATPGSHGLPARSDQRDADSIGGRHGVLLADSKSETTCQLVHLYTGSRSRESFLRDDAAIFASFRALPPGAPVPHP